MRRRTLLLARLLCLPLVTACTESPTAPVADLPSDEAAPSLVSDVPAGGRGPSFALQAPDGGATAYSDAALADATVYDWSDLPYDCVLGATIPSPYHDLEFVGGFAQLGVCRWSDIVPGRPGQIVVPSSDPWGSVEEVRIVLPHLASSVDAEAFEFRPGTGHTTLSAYDADGALLASAITGGSGVESLLVEAAGIAQIGIIGPSATSALGRLEVVYGSNDPADRDACKGRGWEAFGFRNQGQCVRFVETGKDSR